MSGSISTEVKHLLGENVGTSKGKGKNTRTDVVLCIFGPLKKRCLFTSQHKSFPRLEVQARDQITNGWMKAAAECQRAAIVTGQPRAPSLPETRDRSFCSGCD